MTRGQRTCVFSVHYMFLDTCWLLHEGRGDMLRRGSLGDAIGLVAEDAFLKALADLSELDDP